MEKIPFYICSFLALTSALGVVLHPNPIASALFLILSLFTVAIFFLLQQAYLLAVLQILIYAGAIMVLFVFVIMLLNLQTDKLERPRFNFIGVLSAFFVMGVAFLFSLTFINSHLTGLPGEQTPELIEKAGGHASAFSQLLFSEYLFPFELASFILLIAMVGGMLLAKKRLT